MAWRPARFFADLAIVAQSDGDWLHCERFISGLKLLPTPRTTLACRKPEASLYPYQNVAWEENRGGLVADLGADTKRSAPIFYALPKYLGTLRSRTSLTRIILLDSTAHPAGSSPLLLLREPFGRNILVTGVTLPTWSNSQ